MAQMTFARRVPRVWGYIMATQGWGSRNLQASLCIYRGSGFRA